MNNDQQLLQELLAAQTAAQPVVLATIIRSRGSVPRHTGTKMLIYGDGRSSGTIGGGEMESRVIDEAQAALQDGQSRVLPYALVEPSRGDPGVCGGEVEIYLEPYLAPATLFIIGAGHVGRALAELGHFLDFRVAVTDDRAELVTAEHLPQADLLLPGTIEDALTACPLTPNSYVVVVTRNVLVDRALLPHLINTPAPYVGVMGSRRRWQETQRLLLEDGLSAADLTTFHSPLGLELNAESPAEIAVSIMAEIIMLRRGGDGARMAE